jgi:hypothetical protein
MARACLCLGRACSLRPMARWFAVTVLLSAAAGPARAQALEPSTIQDNGRYWKDVDRDRMNTAIANIFRRYDCRISVETFSREQTDWSEGADLDDAKSIRQALKRVTDKRREKELLRSTKGKFVIIVAGLKHFETSVHMPELSKDDRRLVLTGVVERFQSNDLKMERALPDILRQMEQACKGKVEPPIGPAVAAFRNIVTNAGLTPGDLAAVLDARAGVPYQDLSDFARDEINDGRKGGHLKDDLLTFITLFNQKK